MPTTRVYPYQFITYKAFPWFFTRFITGQDPSYPGPGWKIVEAFSFGANSSENVYSVPSGGTSSAHLPTTNAFNSTDASNDGGVRLREIDWIMFETNRGGGATECQVLMITFATSTIASRYFHFYLLPLADYVAGSAKIENAYNIDVKTDQLVVLGQRSFTFGLMNCIAVGQDTGDFDNDTLAGISVGAATSDGGFSYNGTYISHLVNSISSPQRFSIIADEGTCSIWWTDEVYVDWMHFGAFDSIYDVSDDQRPFLIGGGASLSTPTSRNMYRYPPETQVSGSFTLQLTGEISDALTSGPGTVFGKRPILPITVRSTAEGFQGFQGYLRLFYASNDNLGLMGTLKNMEYCYIQVGTQGASAVLVFPWDGVTEL